MAFSLGFIFGPSIGAWFSSIGRSAGHSFAVFQYPAYFALVTGVLTLLLVGLFFKETLPQYKRVSNIATACTLVPAGLQVNIVKPGFLFQCDS